MAENITKTTDLIIPEVMADMIREELPYALKFKDLIDFDYSLKGAEGDTLTLTKFGLMGEAVNVKEGEAIPLDKLTTEKTQVTIKKIGTGLHLSDEAVLSAHGNILAEANEQIKFSIARKIDSDVLKVLSKAKLVYDGTFNNNPTHALDPLSYQTITQALTAFGEKIDVPRVIFVTPKQYSDIQREHVVYNNVELFSTGYVGKIAGLDIIVTANPAMINSDGSVNNIIAEKKALKCLLKRDIMVETERNPGTTSTSIYANELYGLYIADDTKVMVLKTAQKKDEWIKKSNEKKIIAEPESPEPKNTKTKSEK